MIIINNLTVIRLLLETLVIKHIRNETVLGCYGIKEERKGEQKKRDKNLSLIQVQVLLDEHSEAFISRQNPGNLLQLQWQ